MPPTPTTIDKLAWIHLKDRQVLATRTKGNQSFYIPGGKREAGENDQEALQREIKEELSVELIKDSIQYLNSFKAQAHNKPQGTKVKMTCYTANYQGNLEPDHEIEEITFLTSSYILDANCPPVDKIILKFLKEKDLID